MQPVKSGSLKKLIQSLKLLRILKKYELVIFNTASSSKIVRNVAFFLNLYPTKCIGVLHNTERLKSSFTQRIISTKVKNYLVLNDSLSKNHPKYQIQSFYPIFFPNANGSFEKQKETIWISIPGRIDYSRRNFDLLLDCLANNPRLSNIKFLLLGKLDKKTFDGRKLHDQIHHLGVEGYFEIFDHFIPNDEYHWYLSECEYIIPLLKKHENYLHHKISGSFNMAFAHKKPLLCNVFLKKNKDLEENAYFFTRPTLYALLKDISEHRLSKRSFYLQEKWSYNFQQSKYNTFVSSVLE